MSNTLCLASPLVDLVTQQGRHAGVEFQASNFCLLVFRLGYIKAE